MHASAHVMQRVVFPTPEALAEQTADLIARRVGRPGDELESFTIALPGGSTPRGLFRLLAESPYTTRINWGRLQLFWTDERCVPPDDPRSNYRMAAEELLERIPIPTGNIHRIHGEDAPEAAARAYAAEIRSVLGNRRGFDLVLLGVGVDGHTASLFPGDDALDTVEQLAVAVHRPPPEPPRVTLTLAALRWAHELLFLVTGKEKRSVLRRLDAGEDLPAARIRPEEGRLLWFIDRAASPA